MIETLKQHVLSGGMINEEQAKELAAVPDKEASTKQLIRSPATSWETSSTLVPSSMPKAGIAAKTVNGVHSPDIIKQT